MPFSANDLRYHLEESYPALCTYIQHRAQRYLGQLAFDAFEVDQVVGHVIEYLTRIQLLGGGDQTPHTDLDELNNAQFYTVLNRMVQNKAIDRLRRRRLPNSNFAELEVSENEGRDSDPLIMVTESLWGSTPFPSPQESTFEANSQSDLSMQVAPFRLQSQLLMRCIEVISADIVPSKREIEK